MCSGEELSPPCSLVWLEQLFKVRFSELGVPVFQFYCGVCLLMVQVIRIIRTLQEDRLASLQSLARLAAYNSNLKVSWNWN